MAHFAELDVNNIVLRVVVVANSDTAQNGVEDESVGIAFCERLFDGGVWLQTSYNNRIRGTFAQPGYKYDPELDEFLIARPDGFMRQSDIEAEWQRQAALQ